MDTSFQQKLLNHLKKGVNTRVSLLIKQLGHNPNSFSIAIGTRAQTTHKILKDLNYPGYEYLEKILSTFSEVNAEWLMTGMGEMFKSQPSKQKDVKQSSNLVYDSEREKINTNYATTDFDVDYIAHLKQQLFYKDKYIRLLESSNKLLEEKVEDLQNKTDKGSVNTKKGDYKGPKYESG